MRKFILSQNTRLLELNFLLLGMLKLLHELMIRISLVHISDSGRQDSFLG